MLNDHVLHSVSAAASSPRRVEIFDWRFIDLDVRASDHLVFDLL
jgi:hypothetical protein